MKSRWCVALLPIVAGCSSGSVQPPRPANWPDLTVLNNYPNPHGDTCSEDGTTKKGNHPEPDKLQENRLKNRYVLPNSYAAYDVNNMLKLQSSENSQLERSGATLTGYVQDVKLGGTEGESCNCNARGNSEVDAHIEVINDPSQEKADGRGMIVVEVTERSRRLAQAGLLKSNIGNDWSTDQLRKKLVGHWVTFSGWLFYDPDHEDESWSVDRNDKAGSENWRGSPWEIHPALGIEVLASKPSK